MSRWVRIRACGNLAREEDIDRTHKNDYYSRKKHELIYRLQQHTTMGCTLSSAASVDAVDSDGHMYYPNFPADPRMLLATHPPVHKEHHHHDEAGSHSSMGFSEADGYAHHGW